MGLFFVDKKKYLKIIKINILSINYLTKKLVCGILVQIFLEIRSL